MNRLFIDTETVYCAGDLHGNFGGLKYYINNILPENCVLIVCGDIGLGFETEAHYPPILKKINEICEKKNIQVFLFRGNHDDPSYFSETKIYYPNIKTIQDYTVITVSDYNILCIGGSISVDRFIRKKRMNENAEYYLRHHKVPLEEALDKVRSYWPNEPVVYDEEKLNEIIHNCGHINCICTHTAPSDCVPKNTDGIKYFLERDSELEKDVFEDRNTMDKIRQYLMDNNAFSSVEKWVYGHFHMSNCENINGVDYCLLQMYIPEYNKMDIKEIWRNGK